MGHGTELPCVFFIEEEVSHYQIVLYWINWWSVDGDACLVFSGLPKPLHKYWIFTYFFPLKAMTLVTLLENTLHAHRNKRKEEKERQEKCAKPYNSIWASIWNIFLSNKLAARVVSKIVLIVFVLWWVPNILETSSHFFNLCNPQWSIWLYVYKYLRPSIPYTWKSASP